MAFGRKKAPRRSERAKLDATPPWELRARPEPEPTTGPYDEADAPADDLNRVDLGALRVPIAPGVEVQLELEQTQQLVMSATLLSPAGAMQLILHAAPRNEGIWDDVRSQLSASIAEQRGKPAERPGPFGTELTGVVPGPAGRTPARFVGIDGPRWLLRAVFTGPAADTERAEIFEEALRQTIVVRGAEPLPVGDLVPLSRPKDVTLPDNFAGNLAPDASSGDGTG